jgi:hydroxymethylglutaryl-CoA reductase
MSNVLEGFSKKNKEEKLEGIGNFFKNKTEIIRYFKSFHYQDKAIQEPIEEFSENTISNFHLPYSVAPNFLINQKVYTSA